MKYKPEPNELPLPVKIIMVAMWAVLGGIAWVPVFCCSALRFVTVLPYIGFTRGSVAKEVALLRHATLFYFEVFPRIWSPQPPADDESPRQFDPWLAARMGLTIVVFWASGVLWASTTETVQRYVHASANATKVVNAHNVKKAELERSEAALRSEQQRLTALQRDLETKAAEISRDLANAERTTKRQADDHEARIARLARRESEYNQSRKALSERETVAGRRESELATRETHLAADRKTLKDNCDFALNGFLGESSSAFVSHLDDTCSDCNQRYSGHRLYYVHGLYCPTVDPLTEGSEGRKNMYVSLSQFVDYFQPAKSPKVPIIQPSNIYTPSYSYFGSSGR